VQGLRSSTGTLISIFSARAAVPALVATQRTGATARRVPPERSTRCERVEAGAAATRRRQVARPRATAPVSAWALSVNADILWEVEKGEA
jgi:hypothetical protein